MIPDISDPTAAAMLAVLMEVGDERFAQEQKWGQQNHPWGGHRSLYFPLATFVREECETAAATGAITWVHILKEEMAEAFAEEMLGAARKELIQVAAVAVAAIESIDREIAAEEGESELRYGGLPAIDVSLS